MSKRAKTKEQIPDPAINTVDYSTVQYRIRRLGRVLQFDPSKFVREVLIIIYCLLGMLTYVIKRINAINNKITKMLL